MEPVVQVAMQFGIDHIYIPSHEQSLNESEKICNKMWAAGRVLLLHSGQSPTLMSYAVGYAMYVDMRMATGLSRRWLTPFEMIYGYPPSISHIRPFNTLTFVTIPHSKRKTTVKTDPLLRAEAGRLLGYQSTYSTTPCVMLKGNRKVTA